MPVRRPAPALRSGGHPILAALAAAVTAVATATLLADAGQAAARPATPGASTPATGGSEPSTVSGVVERVSVETADRTAQGVGPLGLSYAPGR